MLVISRAARRRAVLLLLLAATVLLPALAEAQAAAGTRRRASCVDCEADARRERALLRLDSLRFEFEHEKLSDARRELLRKEMAVAVRELQAAIGDLRVEMGDIERAQVEAIAAPRIAYSYATRPRGYLGVTFDGPSMEELRGEERVIRFLGYPRISLVEPSSPAERAGVRVGDTLVAMNGIDVLEREISLTKMLVPDEPLGVRLRRDGALRELKVIVGRAPAYVVQRWTAPPMPAEAPGAVGAVTSVRTAPTPRAPGGAAPPAPAVASVWVYSDGVAGAKVETVTEGLGKALGVEGGVLVVRAGPGTPALRSGLRDGDVIVRAAGQQVSTVRELRSALQQYNSGDGVTLVILRERKRREVTLRQ